MIKLNQSEQETLNSYDNDEWVSVVSTSSIADYKSAAANTFKKNKRVNVRISELDLALIQEKALTGGGTLSNINV